MSCVGLETVDHIVAGCSALAPTDYTDRHNQVASIIHWDICRRFGVPLESRWYRHHPDKHVETDEITMMWDTIILTAGSKPIVQTSVSEIGRQTFVFLLISAVLLMATLARNMLRSWQSTATYE